MSVVEVEMKVPRIGRQIWFCGLHLRIALLLALYFHRGQKRGTGEPAISHPLAVYHTMVEEGASIELLIAALLHDVVEDCDGATLFLIRILFGKRVAELVDALTIRVGETKEQAFLRLKETEIRLCLRRRYAGLPSPGGPIRVKAADRLHNLETLQGIQNDAKKLKILEETLQVLRPIFTECCLFIDEPYRRKFEERIGRIVDIAEEWKERLAHEAAL